MSYNTAIDGIASIFSLLITLLVVLIPIFILVLSVKMSNNFDRKIYNRFKEFFSNLKISKKETYFYPLIFVV